VITRRLFTLGMLAAPVVIHTPHLLMPVKKVVLESNRDIVTVHVTTRPGPDYLGAVAQMYGCDRAPGELDESLRIRLIHYLSVRVHRVTNPNAFGRLIQSDRWCDTAAEGVVDTCLESMALADAFANVAKVA
jgi:hypothetical protein